MPFYSCNVPAGSLTGDQKNDLAQNITRIHAEVTGAPPALVHVIYHELAAADSYTAGEPSSDIIISGHIRAGRSDADKQRLLRKVAAASAAITRRPLDTIAVFIRDVPPKYILERGEIAPQLGEEDAWLASRERSGETREQPEPTRVEAGEVEPSSDEHGERWRRVAVRFPETNANHNPDQVFYFDETGRRTNRTPPRRVADKYAH